MEPPSKWIDKVIGIATSLFLAALALYLAGRLVLAVAPVLIGLASAVAVGYCIILISRYRRSRW
jgi:predicted RND superfamily exporter protein